MRGPRLPRRRCAFVALLIAVSVLPASITDRSFERDPRAVLLERLNITEGHLESLRVAVAPAAPLGERLPLTVEDLSTRRSQVLVRRAEDDVSALLERVREDAP